MKTDRYPPSAGSLRKKPKTSRDQGSWKPGTQSSVPDSHLVASILVLEQLSAASCDTCKLNSEAEPRLQTGSRYGWEAGSQVASSPLYQMPTTEGLLKNGILIASVENTALLSTAYVGSNASVIYCMFSLSQPQDSLCFST